MPGYIDFGDLESVLLLTQARALGANSWNAAARHTLNPAQVKLTASVSLA